MDVLDRRVGGHRAPDLGGIEAGGRGLEQDPAGVPQQAVGGAEHDQRDEDRRDSVGTVEAGHEDHRSGHRGGHERDEVGEDVLVGALDVEAADGSPVRAASWRRG